VLRSVQSEEVAPDRIRKVAVYHRAVKGPPITVRCDCGTVQHIPYGESWTCPSCGRRWDTAQIPAEEYEGVMRDMRHYRIQAMWLGSGIGLAVVLLAVLTDRPLFPLALIAMAGWWLVYMPQWRRKVRARARSLPSWKLRSG
jgi:hypothetical protein